MTERSLGMLVIGGIQFPVTSIRIIAAKFHIDAERDGPTPELRNAALTIFGSDGRGLCQGEIAYLAPSDAGQVAHVNVDITFESIHPS